MKLPSDVATERLETNSRLFAYTRWDTIPVAAALLHCAYFFGMFFLFPRVPLWVMLILGFIYSVSISWNINGISHNFIHNPYFRSPASEPALQHPRIGHASALARSSTNAFTCSITRAMPIARMRG